MWCCLESERLVVLLDGATEGGCVHCGSAAHATARVGNALTRILALLGRGPEAASAAELTVQACQRLHATNTEPAAHALMLLGGEHLRMGQLTQAMHALQRAVQTYAGGSGGSGGGGGGSGGGGGGGGREGIRFEQAAAHAGRVEGLLRRLREGIEAGARRR